MTILRREKGDDIIRKICISICLIILMITSYKLYTIGKEYYTNAREYSEIRSEIISIKDKGILEGSEFNKLISKNEEFKFWIKVEGTKIDYPTVQSKDNNKYLHENFSGEKNSGGSIFIDSKNNIDKDKNIVIHGHNMKDGSMFGTLKRLKEKDSINNSEKINIYLNEKTLTYQIFSIYVENNTNEAYKVDFKTDNEYEKYIEILRKKSIHEYKNIKGNVYNDIITLSTCTSSNEDERLIVHAMLDK